MAAAHTTNDFNSVRMDNTVQARMTEVVRQYQFTFLGDTNHGFNEIHELISSRGFMKALADGGAKHLFPEFFDGTMQEIYAAYKGGKIDDAGMEALAHVLGGTNSEEDHGADGARWRQSLANFMRHAKELGFEVTAVDHYAGIFAPEQADRLHALAALAGRDIVDYMNTLPEFRNPAASRDDKIAAYRDAMTEEKVPERLRETGKTLRDAYAEQTLRTQERVDAYVNDGYDRKDAKDKVISEITRERLEHDYNIALRMAAKAGDEKAVVIYGVRHMRSLFGDLDANLPRAAVVEIYADEKAQLAARPHPASKLSGILTYERPEYTFDIASGNWSDGKTSVRLALPEGVAPPSPERSEQILYPASNKEQTIFGM